MFQAGDGAGRDARSAFEVFRRDAGQRHAPDLITRRFPCLPRHAQHRALARSGIADHDAKIAPVRDMRQRVGLLAGQDKAALFGMCQSGLAVPSFTSWRSRSAINSAARCRRCSVSIICAGGETVLAASVLAEFDQIGRIAHRAHDLVELVDPVAVPVREHRHVAPREGRLLLRDRVQRDGQDRR